MKKIICYGDSNTFGYNSKDNSRFDETIRWTAILQKNLGAEYKIINEGMCNRTGFADNPAGELFSAQKHFPKMLSENDNIDLLILAIGTNDLMNQYNISFEEIDSGLKKLIKLAKEKVNNIILIPPVVMDEDVLKGFFKPHFDTTSIEKSKKLCVKYEQIANLCECEYFDINKIAKPSNTDGIHYDEISHKLIADGLTDFIRKNYFKKHKI